MSYNIDDDSQKQSFQLSVTVPRETLNDFDVKACARYAIFTRLSQVKFIYCRCKLLFHIFLELDWKKIMTGPQNVFSLLLHKKTFSLRENLWMWWTIPTKRWTVSIHFAYWRVLDVKREIFNYNIYLNEFDTVSVNSLAGVNFIKIPGHKSTFCMNQTCVTTCKGSYLKKYNSFS